MLWTCLWLAGFFGATFGSIDVGMGGDRRRDALFKDLKRHQDAFVRLQRKINATIQLSETISNNTGDGAIPPKNNPEPPLLGSVSSGFNSTLRRLLDRMGAINITGDERDAIIGDLHDLGDSFEQVLEIAKKANNIPSEEDTDTFKPPGKVRQAEELALVASLKEFQDLESQFEDLKEFFAALKREEQQMKRSGDGAAEIVEIP